MNSRRIVESAYLSLAGDYASVRFSFAKIGVNECYGDFCAPG